MKCILTFLIFCFTLLHSKAQTDSIRILNYYKNSKYELDTLSLKNTKAKLIIARPILADTFTDNPVWLHFDTEVPRDNFINSITSETGIYIPTEQPLTDFYLVVSCSEGHGNIILIDKKGNLTTIPGYQFAIDKAKSAFYTKSPGDGEYIVSKFNPKTRKLETKSWTNIDGEPWDNELNYYKIKTTDWVK
jgi:hypothetical protein